MKAKRLIPPFLLLLTLSGCSGRSEVRDKGFIRTIGADCNDVQTISLQLYGSDEVLTGQGTTLFSAIADSERTQGKNLFAGHLELFAASPENIYKNLSSLLQNNRISPSCSVICVPENAAGLVAESESDFLPEIIDNSKHCSVIWTFFTDKWVVSPAHNRTCICLTLEYRNFCSHSLSWCKLIFSAKRHKHS